MVCGFASKEPPSWHELQHAILRNFGGLDTVKPIDGGLDTVKPIDVFNKYLKNVSRNAKVVSYLLMCLIPSFFSKLTTAVLLKR